jgi:hypothetical protein
MSIADKIRKMTKDAPKVSAGSNVNYGELTSYPIVVTFHGRGVKPTSQKLVEYAEEHEVEVEDVELSDNEQLQIHFSIAVQDLNPSLTFESVDRDIAVMQSNGKNKADWQEIVEPSLLKVFGPNWAEVLFGKPGKDPKPVYVAAEMVDSLRFVKPGAKSYTTIKFIEKYADRDECIEARDARYGKRDETLVVEEDIEDDVADDVADEEEEDQFPAATLKQVYSLWKGAKRNDSSTLKLIGSNKAWKSYAPKELLAAAKKLDG